MIDTGAMSPLVEMHPTSVPLPEGAEVEEFLAALNEAQREAVQVVDGPLLCLAGAGSGKTRVLTTRIAYMIRYRQIAPQSILALTFTRKAAEEMRHRLSKLVDSEAAAAVTLGTFHGVGAQILREYGSLIGVGGKFAIADEADVGVRVRKVLDALDVPKGIEGYRPRDVSDQITRAKVVLASLFADRYFARDAEESFESAFAHEYRSPNQELWTSLVEEGLMELPDPEMFANIYETYQAGLVTDNVVDYQDLISLPLLLFLDRAEVLRLYRERWQYLTVDEYQDTDRVQDHLLRVLAGPRCNLFVVGDDDQAIYGWRGAEVENIRTFTQRYECGWVKMEDNYRSTPNILRIANAALVEQKDRPFAKVLRPNQPEGVPVRLWTSSCAEVESEAIIREVKRLWAEGMIGSFEEVLVLYRLNSLAYVLEAALRREKFAYRLVNAVRFHERKEIKDLLAYLRLVDNWQDTSSFERVVNVPSRKIGPASMEVVLQYARVHGMTPVDAALQAEKIEGLNEKQISALRDFGDIIATAGDKAAAGDAAIVLHHILERTSYIDRQLVSAIVRAEEKDDEDKAAEFTDCLHVVQDFIQYVEEFCRTYRITGGASGASVTSLLETLATLNAGDESPEPLVEREAGEDNPGAITLMSIHAAKGLEAPVVFVIGLEEEILPAVHPNAEEDSKELAEEERLFYVAVTRAMSRLYLCYSYSRALRKEGDPKPYRRSRFLSRLPEDGGFRMEYLG